MRITKAPKHIEYLYLRVKERIIDCWWVLFNNGTLSDRSVIGSSVAEMSVDFSIESVGVEIFWRKRNDVSDPRLKRKMK